MTKSIAFFGGAGIGLLIGILIGMTTSSIVGVIIGTLSSILLVLLGYKEKETSQFQAVRVGAFGLFCVIGILSGVYLRVNNAFAPNISSEITNWTKDSLFNLEEAKSYVLYNRFGFLPDSVKIDTTKSKQGSTVLFNANYNQSVCEKLELYESFSINEELDAYARLDGTWLEVSQMIRENVELKNQKKVLHLIRKSLCNENQ